MYIIIIIIKYINNNGRKKIQQHHLVQSNHFSFQRDWRKIASWYFLVLSAIDWGAANKIMSDKLSVAFSEDVEEQGDTVDRNRRSLPRQHIKDVLDLVKNGIITKSEGESLIEEYKRQSESNQAVRKQLLMRKQKILRRQDTNEKNLAKLVREGYLSEEEAAMILEDIREVEKHENLDSRAPLDNKDKHQRPVRHSSLRGFKKYEKSSGSLESRANARAKA